ncbi:MAG TPA: FAD-dependent oxidoreductase, partial [Gemmatimonadales bacterium]|nr:FAD-dependent oxidoreductase [Gemmatimonadales bacterium]
MHVHPVLVAGGGPAGLTAGLELVRAGVPVAVHEASDAVGGIARTETYRGYRFDIGGHRFYTKVPEVERVWHDLLGGELLRVQRLSRIFYEGRYYAYPLQLPNVVRNLGVVESARMTASYLRARLQPASPEETLEDWVVNRFGDRLYRTFFKTYTEKVWGLPCHVIRADWAAQRIRGLSFTRAVSHALFRSGRTTSLVGEFLYPRLGPGQMWERAAAVIAAAGGAVHRGSRVVELHHDGRRVTSATVEGMEGRRTFPVSDVISSMPLPALVRALTPAPDSGALDAAARLRFRDFLIVVLIVNRPDVFPDNWLYIHSPDVRVGRVQNFKNWSAAMVPDPGTTSLGMEYFCSADDDVWRRDDAELIRMATAEVDSLGLVPAGAVVDGCVIRQL